MKFPKRRGELWTKTNTNNTKALTEYILINKKLINSALNCKAYSSFKGVSSNHRIVTGKTPLNRRRITLQTTKTSHYEWSMFNKRDISEKYTITVRNKFYALQEISKTLTPHNEYENFVNAFMEEAVEYTYLPN